MQYERYQSFIHKISLITLLSSSATLPAEGGTMETRALTLRLPADQAAQIEAVARADGVSVSETVRAAITDRIEARRKDRAFQARIRRMMEEERAVLEQLAR